MNATMSRMGVLAGFLLSILAASPARASFTPLSFTSLYCFGDGVCTTTDNTGDTPDLYHEGRYCNGRVWLEVFAEWQGLPYAPANNLSYFGHSSAALVSNTAAFSAPADVATSLVVIWSANADLVGFVHENSLGYTPADIPAWTAEIDQAVLLHLQAVTNLFNKGVRNVVLLGAADVTETPAYIFIDPPSARSFIRARAIQFNAALELAMRGLASSHSGLTVHLPEVFGFFDKVITNPGDFGLVNSPGDAGALVQSPPYQLDGPEADYVFWDYWHPSAKFQMLLAEFIKDSILPVRFTGIDVTGGEAQLQLVNIPLGCQGVVESRASRQVEWQEAAVIDEPVIGGSTGKLVPVPANGPAGFFRARFPVVWTWP